MRYGESFASPTCASPEACPRTEVVLFLSPAGILVVAPLPGRTHRIVATVPAAPEQPDLRFVQDLLDSRGSCCAC